MEWMWIAAIIVLVITGLGGFIFLMRKWIAESSKIQFYLETLERNHERIDRLIREEMCRIRDDASTNAQQTRNEVAAELKAFGDSMHKVVTDMVRFQQNHLEISANQMNLFTKNSEERIERIRESVEVKLKQIQDDNAKSIEQLRLTVDEKLQGTLERRLGESFRQVSERLEQVHRGLGDMQNLAAGVGDLKRIFSNVKSRGIWGEVHLENLLAEILSPGQYEKNVRTKDRSNEVVEFAIKLPGVGGCDEDVVWLPIDAKFPIEDYQRLVDAQEKGDIDAATDAIRMLETRLKNCAKDIFTKYLNPPRTTDFAVMYLPVEGLYAEAAKRPDLMAVFQREYRVLVAGPSTFAALLNSLQIGFRTLAIQKRSSEVWQILSTVKTEFGKFGEVLEAVKKKLEQVTNNMDDALKRSRVIQRKLRNVQEIDQPGAPEIEMKELDENAED
jgi:DNA recombination protein RmuC